MTDDIKIIPEPQKSEHYKLISAFGTSTNHQSDAFNEAQEGLFEQARMHAKNEIYGLEYQFQSVALSGSHDRAIAHHYVTMTGYLYSA